MKKININKKFMLSSAYEEYKYLLEFMPGHPGPSPAQNYRRPGISDINHPEGKPGSDYPFYAYFSSLIDNTTILEVGTHQGGSATMLSHNETNKVITYDIVNILPGPFLRSNIEFRVGNFMEDNIDYDQIDLITLDVDPHDGNQEKVMIEFLENNWKGGLLMLDDIHKDGMMEEFWNSIDDKKHQKFDITDIGHCSGTGLLNFNRYFEVSFK